MKSPSAPASPMRSVSGEFVDRDGLLLARVQLREESGAMAQELRTAVGHTLSEVPLEDKSVDVRVLLVSESSSSSSSSSSSASSSSSSSSSWPNLAAHWHRRPLAVLLLACGDLDEFKERHLRNVHRWIDEAEARQLEWMIVISEGAQRGRGRSVFEKMKGEAGKKEEQVVLWESGLPAVMTLLRKTMGASLSRALRDFREHIRGLETRRGTEGWNCAQYLIAQEGLASVLEKSSHWQEAKATLEQAEAVVCEEMKSVGFPKLWQSEDAGLCSAASSEGREKIHRSESSAFQALSYVAGRQLQMIARHDTPEAVLKRAAFVIKVQRKRAMQLQKQNEEWSRVWAANAWREVADLLPAGDSAWAVLALRNAAEYDGDWSVVARSGARRAQTEGRYRSGQTSSAGVDEGWTLLRSCTLLQEAKQRIARGEPELSVEAPELLLLEKKEKLEDGSVRVWLDKDVSVLVVLPPPPQKPVSEDVTKSPPPSHTSSSVVAEPAVVALPDPPSLSMSFSSKLEARASVVSPGVVQVRVCCDDEAVLSVNGTTGSSLLAPSDVFEVSVKTASGRIVSVKVEHESDTASVSSDSISCCLTHAAELHVGDWAQFVVCTRLSANGIVFIDGGDDWTLVGRTVASVPSGEQTLSYLASPRRAGLLLLPRPHVKQHLTKCEGMRAVRVSPLKATACATRPGRRDDEDEEEQSIGVVSSPDPKMLRYSAPPRINK